MNIREALGVVHSLAYQNLLEEHDGEEVLVKELERQERAVSIVCDLLTAQMEVDNYGQLVIYTGKMEGSNGELVDFDPDTMD